MAIQAAELLVKVSSDVSAAVSGLNRVNKAVTSAGGFFSGAAQTALGFAGGMAALGAVSAVVGGVSNAVVGLSSTLEGSAIALETMLGSSEAAADQLNKLKQFAAATPFELPQLLEAQQRLLAFGFGVNDVIPLLTDLGNAAAGLNLGAGGMSRLVTAIGQIQAKGKVQGDELLQLTEAGVPGLRLLAEHLGKTTEETQALVSAGKVSAGTFLTAFQGFARQNFGGLMARQAETFTGAVSNIKDALGFGLAEAFAPIFDLVRSLALDFARLLQTSAFAEFVVGVRAGIAALVQPIAAFLAMVGSIAEAHGLNLFEAALVALQLTLERVFGPATAQLFNDLVTGLRAVATWAGEHLPQAFGWLGERLPGWIEAGAAALQRVGQVAQAVGAAFAAVGATVFGVFDAIRTKLEDVILAVSQLPLIGAALQPTADAIRAQRATAEGAGRQAAAGTPFGRAGAAIVNIALNGPINADNAAQVQALADAIAQAVTGAVEQAEPAPSPVLAGMLP